MSEHYYAVYDHPLLGEEAEDRVRRYHDGHPADYTMAHLLKDASQMEDLDKVVIVTVVE